MNKWNCFKNPVTNSERFQMVDCFSVIWKASLGTVFTKSLGDWRCSSVDKVLA